MWHATRINLHLLKKARELTGPGAHERPPGQGKDAAGQGFATPPVGQGEPEEVMGF
jgi:hypothetical protein